MNLRTDTLEVARATPPTAARAEARAAVRARTADYLELTKPRITTLVVITTLVGFEMAVSMTGAAPGAMVMAAALAGTFLVAGGANSLNQLLERDVDARMQRTRDRPLPTGRLNSDQALAFGATITAAGVLILALGADPLAGALAAATFASYVFVYTPLKRWTPLNTLVGAVPGAMPPVIGWAAASGHLHTGAWAIFAIMFVWQLPHFLAIAWLYRHDYARGGLPMLPVVQPDGASTSRHIASTCAGLLPVSVAPTLLGMTSTLYFAGAAVLGLAFLVCGFRLALDRSERNARVLFLASLVYLPVLLVLMIVDRMPA